MDSNQSELDFLADQTMRLNESINDNSFVFNQTFDEDLIEHERLKESFVFAPVEQQLEFSFEGPSVASIEEIEALCLGVLGQEISLEQEDVQEFQANSGAEEFICEGFSFEECDFDIVVDLEMPQDEEELSFDTREELDIVVDLEEEFIEEIEKEKDVEKSFVFNGPSEELDLPILTTGIAYNIISNPSTFTVKAVCLEDLESFDLTDEMRVALRLDEEKFPEFFVTESFESAVKLKSQIANRRFMIHEDSVCNIGDPGFSWWFEKTDNGISIYFKSYKINRAEEAIRLGPLGESSKAIDILSNFHRIFSDIVPVSEFSCDENALHLYSEIDSHEIITGLSEVFENGEFLFSEEDFPEGEESLELFSYLKDVALVRSWWLEITENL